MSPSNLILRSHYLNPFKNLALGSYISKSLSSKYLHSHDSLGSYVAKASSVLILSASHHGVLIGRNQNYLSECNLPVMARDNVPLVRRDTGGGACYVDKGNRLFSFITQKDTRSQNYQIIIDAIKSLGINVNIKGRNDIVVSDGNINPKISGSAFSMDDKVMRHHGTILVNVDKDKLSTYLNPNKLKLSSHGVKSVRSRIANLTDYNPNITMGDIDTALISQYKVNYPESTYEMLEIGPDYWNIESDSLFHKIYKELSSPSFIYDDMTIEKSGSKEVFHHKFEYGLYEFHVIIKESTEPFIMECKVYSDDLDVDFVNCLQGFIGFHCPITLRSDLELMTEQWNDKHKTKLLEVMRILMQNSCVTLM